MNKRNPKIKPQSSQIIPAVNKHDHNMTSRNRQSKKFRNLLNVFRMNQPSTMAFVHSSLSASQYNSSLVSTLLQSTAALAQDHCHSQKLNAKSKHTEKCKSLLIDNWRYIVAVNFELVASKPLKNEGREIRTPNLLIWSQTRCRCPRSPCPIL